MRRMTVYLLFGAIALAAVCGADHFAGSNARVSNALWFVTFLALFIPAALRYDIGVDYSSTMETSGYLGYYQLYQLYATEPPAAGMDLGFYALIRVLNLFTGNPQWMFAVMSALSCGLTLRACRRLSPMPAVSVALFMVAGFYFEGLNIARQWVAIACVLNGLEWVGGVDALRGERSFVRYAIWVVAGSLMHTSCLIWLAIWPFFSLKMNVRRACALALAFVVLSFAAEKASAVALAGTRFGLYLDPTSDVYVGPQPRLNAVICYGITWVFTVVCLCGLSGERQGSAAVRELSSSDEANAPSKPLSERLVAATSATCGRWDSALVVIATITLCLFVSTYYLPHIVDRLARYFAPVLILAMPRCLVRIPNKRLHAAALVVIVVAWLAATYVQVVAGGQYGVVPYQSIFGVRAVQGLLS